jgi:hypothetical protein
MEELSVLLSQTLSLSSVRQSTCFAGARLKSKQKIRSSASFENTRLYPVKNVALVLKPREKELLFSPSTQRVYTTPHASTHRTHPHIARIHTPHASTHRTHPHTARIQSQRAHHQPTTTHRVRRTYIQTHTSVHQTQTSTHTRAPQSARVATHTHNRTRHLQSACDHLSSCSHAIQRSKYTTRPRARWK